MTLVDIDRGIIGLAPALCCTEREMDLIFGRTRKALDEVLKSPDIIQAMGR